MSEIKLIKQNNPKIHLHEPYENEFIKVHFIGDITFTKYSAIGFHTNPGYEICIIPYGKGFFKIGDKTYPICRKQCFITKAPQFHDGWPSRENPFRILYLCFEIKQGIDPNSVWNSIANELENINEPLAEEKFDMECIHHRMIDEVLNKHIFSKEMLESLVRELILLTIRNFAQITSPNIYNGSSEIENALSSKIMHLVDQHIFNEINLKDISSKLNYSTSYICRTFKKQTGFTVMEYYNFTRLEKAKKLLIETTDTITEISSNLNFSSVHHFSNAFKALFEISPIKYRNTHVQNNVTTE